MAMILRSSPGNFIFKKNQNMNLKGHIETSTQDALMYVEEG